MVAIGVGEYTRRTPASLLSRLWDLAASSGYDRRRHSCAEVPHWASCISCLLDTSPGCLSLHE
eukprot:827931-Pleurochrysis_carterae.AAC.1